MTFELSPDLAQDLPPTVVTILQEFVATLTAAMRLESVILFGSAAEGRLRPTSDLNLLVVANDWTLQQLDAARLPLRSGRAAAGLTVMFLKSSEVAAAVEGWPIVLLGCAVLVLIAFIKIEVALASGHSNIGFLVVLTAIAVIVLLGRTQAAM